MEQLLDKNDIVCLQETDGILETLRAVASDKGFLSTGCHWEGVDTLYNPKAGLDLVRRQLRPVWPLGTSAKKFWRLIQCCTFRVASAQSPGLTLVVCNNSTHDGRYEFRPTVNPSLCI